MLTKTQLKELKNYVEKGKVLEFTFSGAGDSGDIDNYIKEEIPLELLKALETVAHDVLEVHCPGWEINDGSSGSIDIDVWKGTYEINCSWTVTTTENVDYKGKLVK